MTKNYPTLEKQVAGELTADILYRNSHSYVKISNPEKNDSVVVPLESFTNTYRYFLKNEVKELTFTDAQYKHFRQNPHALSDVLYGSTHYWAMLLELNNCTTRFEFDLHKVKYYDPLSIVRLLNEIYLKESTIEI